MKLELARWRKFRKSTIAFSKAQRVETEPGYRNTGS